MGTPDGPRGEAGAGTPAHAAQNDPPQCADHFEVCMVGEICFEKNSSRPLCCARAESSLVFLDQPLLQTTPSFRGPERPLGPAQTFFRPPLPDTRGKSPSHHPWHSSFAVGCGVGPYWSQGRWGFALHSGRTFVLSEVGSLRHATDTGPRGPPPTVGTLRMQALSI